MNIEKQIKDLTDAIIRLTEIMESQLEAQLEGGPVKYEDMKPDQIVEEFHEHVITAKHVKELAKAKMIAGVERKTIKAMVTKLKADSIADLSSKDLKSLHKQIGEL
jgi:hypothetical protein|tara:strand:- start:2032 stop:2349 length:318 start_codon:yes stop_codon:yes gene_type:complete